MIRWHLPPPIEPRPIERAYREDLAAAHARIGELEAQVRALGASGVDRDIQTLERRRRAAERGASRPNIRKVIAFSSLFPVVLFCGPALVVVIASPDVHAHVFPVIGLCVGVVVGALAWLVMPRSAYLALQEAENDLAAAMRVRELERQLQDAHRATHANHARDRERCTD